MELDDYEKLEDAHHIYYYGKLTIEVGGDGKDKVPVYSYLGFIKDKIAIKHCPSFINIIAATGPTHVKWMRRGLENTFGMLQNPLSLTTSKIPDCC